jgi:hypothetical protein
MPPGGGGALDCAAMSGVENITRLIRTKQDFVKGKMRPHYVLDQPNSARPEFLEQFVQRISRAVVQVDIYVASAIPKLQGSLVRAIFDRPDPIQHAQEAENGVFRG